MADPGAFASLSPTFTLHSTWDLLASSLESSLTLMVPFHSPGFYSYSRLYTDINRFGVRIDNQKEHVAPVFGSLCYFIRYTYHLIPSIYMQRSWLNFPLQLRRIPLCITCSLSIRQLKVTQAVSTYWILWLQQQKAWLSKKMPSEMSSPLGACPGVEAGSYGGLEFSTLGESPQISKMATPVGSPTNSGWGPISLLLHQHLWPGVFLIIAKVFKVSWNLKVTIICISLVAKGTELFLTKPPLNLLLRTLFGSTASFWLGYLCSWILFLALCIHWCHPLLDGQLKILSHSAGFLFSWTTASCAIGKLFNFIRSHLSTPGALFRKSFLHRYDLCFLLAPSGFRASHGSLGSIWSWFLYKMTPMK